MDETNDMRDAILDELIDKLQHQLANKVYPDEVATEPEAKKEDDVKAVVDSIKKEDNRSEESEDISDEDLAALSELPQE